MVFRSIIGGFEVQAFQNILEASTGTDLQWSTYTSLILRACTKGLNVSPTYLKTLALQPGGHKVQVDGDNYVAWYFLRIFLCVTLNCHPSLKKKISVLKELEFWNHLKGLEMP